MTFHSKAMLAALLLAFPLPSPARGDDEKPKIVVMDQGDTVEVDGGRGHRVRLAGGVNRAWLGIDLIEVTPELRAHWGAPRDAGVLVGAVEKDSPAERAGVQVGDLVTEIEGERVSSPWEVIRAMREKNAGDSVKLELSRNRSSKSVSVQVAARPEREVEISEFGPRLEREIEKNLGRELSRNWTFEMPERFRSGRTDELRRLRERLEGLERRLKELEGKRGH